MTADELSLQPQVPRPSASSLPSHAPRLLYHRLARPDQHHSHVPHVAYCHAWSSRGDGRLLCVEAARERGSERAPSWGDELTLALAGPGRIHHDRHTRRFDYWSGKSSREAEAQSPEAELTTQPEQNSELILPEEATERITAAKAALGTINSGPREPVLDAPGATGAADSAPVEGPFFNIDSAKVSFAWLVGFEPFELTCPYPQALLVMSALLYERKEPRQVEAALRLRRDPSTSLDEGRNKTWSEMMVAASEEPIKRMVRRWCREPYTSAPLTFFSASQVEGWGLEYQRISDHAAGDGPFASAFYSPKSDPKPFIVLAFKGTSPTCFSEVSARSCNAEECRAYTLGPSPAVHHRRFSLARLGQRRRLAQLARALLPRRKRPRGEPLFRTWRGAPGFLFCVSVTRRASTRSSSPSAFVSLALPLFLLRLLMNSTERRQPHEQDQRDCRHALAGREACPSLHHRPFTRCRPRRLALRSLPLRSR